MYTLESERLSLRPFTWDDLDFLAALHADPNVARYIGYGIPRTRQESYHVLERTLLAHSGDSVGQLAVVLNSSHELVGRCGLTLVETEADPAPGHPPRWFWFRGSAPDGMKITHELELGYAFATQYWGHGYATESASAVRDHAFAHHNMERLVAAIIADNTASKNVARKVGLAPTGEIIAFGRSAQCYEICRTDWRCQME